MMTKHAKLSDTTNSLKSITNPRDLENMRNYRTQRTALNPSQTHKMDYLTELLKRTLLRTGIPHINQDKSTPKKNHGGLIGSRTSW